MLRFKEVPGFPAALTAIREFHRLRARWRRVGVLTIDEARQLTGLRAFFEPPHGPGEGDWHPVLIIDRRPIAICKGARSARGELVAFALWTAVLRVEFDARPDDLIRLAIPRHPDGKWHRFIARVVDLSRARRRMTVRFERPEGDA